MAIGMEKKYNDQSFTINVGAVDQNGHITPTLSGIAQGDTPTTRVGRKVSLKAFMCRYYINFPTENNAQETDEVVRVIFYLDKAPNGSAATPSDILAIIIPASAPTYNNYRNMDQIDRFDVFYDRTHKLDKAAGANNGGTDVFAATGSTGKVYKRLNHVALYSGTTGAVGSMVTNNIGMLVISKSNKCSMEGSARVRYYG